MKKLTINLNLFFLFLLPVLAVAQNQVVIFPSNTRYRATSQYYQEEAFQRIGNYQVKGNSYLLKGANITDTYTTIGYGSNLPVVFDAYTQQVSILLENKKDMVKLTSAELDSFIVKIDNEKKFQDPVIFINASRMESGKKMYLQRLTNEAGYNLYKSYKAEMKPAALDIAQTNIMAFEILSEYFYLDNNSTSKQSFVKIKMNAEGLKKKFADKPEAVELLRGINKEKQEDILIAFFEKLNK